MRTVFVLIHQLIRFAFHAVACFLLAFGLAALPAAISFRKLYPEGLDARFLTLADGWIEMGAAAVVGGTAGLALLVFSAPGRGLSAERARPAPVLSLVFIVLGAIGLVLSGPFFTLWRDSLALLDAWKLRPALSVMPPEFSGLILLPALPVVFLPFIEAAALVVFVASPCSSLSNVFLREGRSARHSPRASHFRASSCGLPSSR